VVVQEAATHSLGQFVPAHLANMLDALAALRMRGPATDALVAGAARFSVSGSGRFDISHHATMLNAFAELTPPHAEAHPEVCSCCEARFPQPDLHASDPGSEAYELHLCSVTSADEALQCPAAG